VFRHLFFLLGPMFSRGVWFWVTGVRLPEGSARRLSRTPFKWSLDPPRECLAGQKNRAAGLYQADQDYNSIVFSFHLFLNISLFHFSSWGKFCSSGQLISIYNGSHGFYCGS